MAVLTEDVRTALGEAFVDIAHQLRATSMTPAEMDNFACERLLKAAKASANVVGYVSENQGDLIWTQDPPEEGVVPVLATNPVDGTRNIGACITVGTVYCLYEVDVATRKIVRPLHAGYCLYSFACLWISSREEGGGLDIHRLNADNKFEFERTVDKMGSGRMYAVNHSYEFDPKVKAIINFFKNASYASRWVGCMIADVHQVICTGGIYMYPSTVKHGRGKMRYVYEALPMAFLLSQIGGIGLTERGKPLLDEASKIVLKQEQCHARTPVFLCDERVAQEFRDVVASVNADF